MDLNKIIDGKNFAGRVLQEVKKHAAIIQQQHKLKPGLAVVLVGDDPASSVYVRSKAKRSLECGFESFEYRLPSTTSQEKLVEQIKILNEDSNVHGILVQLPLPNGINDEQVIESIDPVKDVDGFHIMNAGKLATNTGNPHLPCTPLGCLWLLRDRLGSLAGKHVVIIGRSNIVGKPMAQLLLNADCTITIVHSRTKNIEAITREADIVVAAVGKARFVQENWIKSGATVIDVGINRIEENGRNILVGDVDFEGVIDKVGGITPVPGGVGPMTIAMLLVNTLSAACLQHNIGVPDWKIATL